MRILMARPSLSEEELQAVKQVFDTGWLGEGTLTDDFEAAICEYTGAPFAVAVNTGTSALHLSLAAHGVGPGDDVILPSFTFASDAMAILHCGATPIFADIDPDTLNLSPEAVASVMTPRTRAILPTDYAGLPADVPGIRGVAGHDILLIRDASHSFGSYENGMPIGVNHGEDATCFSFDPIKNLTCGEGGAVLVRDKDLAESMTAQRRLGFQHNSWSGLNGGMVKDRRAAMMGYRYHLGNLNAAIGLAQFTRFPQIISGKRRVARRYDQLLASIQEVQLFSRDYDSIVPFIYPILVDQNRRDALVRHLGAQGIHAGLRYFPCHRQPLFETLEHSDLPVTERVTRELICLPLYAELKDEEVDEVVGHIQAFFTA